MNTLPVPSATTTVLDAPYVQAALQVLSGLAATFEQTPYGSLVLIGGLFIAHKVLKELNRLLTTLREWPEAADRPEPTPPKLGRRRRRLPRP